ncbi:RcnB family protein [Caulobacter sp. UNC358MFTsu5.1]|uniref:RcnB family protein n=1 Tax=Caulobacter sp. UNC358MFTsu5.1 TaxID=1449049 RepID=UPI0004A74D48|nr:RcnB family protein [Caulobacter sp. UNC358MFTsu5.1]
MKKFLTAAVALSIVASAGVASAQPGPQRPDQHQQQGYNDRDRHDNDRHDDRHDSQWERHASKRYKAPGRYQPPRGYQARQWHRGDRLPASYRGKAYVVDYRHYGLGAPPRGYQYVRVDNDVVLAAVATGVVSSVIFQLFQ